MTELLCVALLFLASALTYGSASVPSPRVRPWFRPGAASFGARCVAAVAIVGACTLWQRGEPGPAGVLVTLTGFIVTSTLVTLLASVVPRAIRAATIACVIAIPPLAWTSFG